MGYGVYSLRSRTARSRSLGWDEASASAIFKERSLNTEMSPKNVTLREARDSEEHPESIPIIIALDVTGSMGSIPHFLVKEGLPHLIDRIIQSGIPHPQVLFIGIGDHEVDRAPLQIGQFESNDELLDKWLTSLWIEGGGGGNDGESYLLAWMFASRFTSTDHFEKRGKKGIMFTIGDEPTLKNLPGRVQQAIMGHGQYKDATAAELLELAREKFEVYHLHLSQGHAGRSQTVKDGWKQLIGDNVFFIQNKDQVSQTIADVSVQVLKEQGMTRVAESNRKQEEEEEEVL